MEDTERRSSAAEEPDSPKGFPTVRNIGQGKRAAIAKVARALLETRTALDPKSVQSTIDILQELLPDIANKIIGDFHLRRDDSRPVPLVQECTGGHLCMGHENIGWVSVCPVEACATQVCQSHQCESQTCGTEACDPHKCQEHAAIDCEISRTAAFAAVQKALASMSTDPDVQQKILLTINTAKLR